MHGFYAVMGGLAIHISDSLPESQRFFLSNTNETLFINYHGMLYLMQREPDNDGILNISKRNIQSKSKANGLAKGLVCVQALWFIAQCSTRRK